MVEIKRRQAEEATAIFAVKVPVRWVMLADIFKELMSIQISDLTDDVMLLQQMNKPVDGREIDLRQILLQLVRRKRYLADHDPQQIDPLSRFTYPALFEHIFSIALIHETKIFYMRIICK